MLMLLLDAAILMFLMKAINDDDVGFGSALLAALGTGILTLILFLGLLSVMGPESVVVASLIASVLGAIFLGLLLAFFFGMLVNRAFLIAGLFFVIDFAVRIGINLMFS